MPSETVAACRVAGGRAVSRWGDDAPGVGLDRLSPLSVLRLCVSPQAEMALVVTHIVVMTSGLAWGLGRGEGGGGGRMGMAWDWGWYVEGSERVKLGALSYIAQWLGEMG